MQFFFVFVFFILYLFDFSFTDFLIVLALEGFRLWHHHSSTESTDSPTTIGVGEEKMTMSQPGENVVFFIDIFFFIASFFTMMFFIIFSILVFVISLSSSLSASLFFFSPTSSS